MRERLHHVRRVNIAPVHEFVKLQEKCGTFGVWTESGLAATYVRFGQNALQDRGRDFAGIAAFVPGIGIDPYARPGFVSQVITEGLIKRRYPDSKAAIGHNRYRTTGRNISYNAQPTNARSEQHEISIAHNGNIYDLSGIPIFNGQKKDSSDTVRITKYALEKRKQHDNWTSTLLEIFNEIADKGSFAGTILTHDVETGQQDLFAVRDPYRNRPLSLGQLEDGWVFASESAALDAVGAHFVRDLAGGEMMRVDQDGNISSYFFGDPRIPQECMLEYVYFGRPDSYMNGVRLMTGRNESGRRLYERMEQKGIESDIITPVYDSGREAWIGAIQVAKEIPVSTIVTERYFGRTFIMDGQVNRVKGVAHKHNLVPDEVRGKRVMKIDDSNVRHNTSRNNVGEMRQGGATKVDAGFASHAFYEGCDRGINLNTNELPTAQMKGKPLEEVEAFSAQIIGADSVTYLPTKDMIESYGKKPEHVCYTCFGGPHGIKDRENPDYFQQFRQKEKLIVGLPKLSIFISGGGTNLQNIINHIETGNIQAEINGVLSNNPDAYGLIRAENHGIPTFVAPSKGILSNIEKRAEYNSLLIEHVKQQNPDVLLLAGWMVVLGDEFLEEMQKMEVPVVNLHPALLTDYPASKINTSRGPIPVVRGAHAIQDAYDSELPVSGVTIHQVLPNNTYDVGPVILKEEVRRNPSDTLCEWEQKIHDAEYRTLPTALKRVLHVINHGVDVSKGDFPW